MSKNGKMGRKRTGQKCRRPASALGKRKTGNYGLWDASDAGKGIVITTIKYRKQLFFLLTAFVNFLDFFIFLIL